MHVLEQSHGFPLLLTKSEVKTPEFDANTEPVLRTILLTKSEPKTPEFVENTEPVLGTLFFFDQK